jgi:hypothetical protein
MSEKKKKIYDKNVKYIFIRKMKLPKFKPAKEEADFWAKFDSAQILDAGEEIFAWASQSQLKVWLKDPGYIFWLGKTR